jgi:hypothetical protein
MENEDKAPPNFVQEHLNKALYWGSASCSIPIPNSGGTAFGTISMQPPVLNPYNAVPQEQRSYYTIKDQEDDCMHDTLSSNSQPYLSHLATKSELFDLSHPQLATKKFAQEDYFMEDNEENTTEMEELIPTNLLQ